MMKNALYFTLKGFFVPKIFKFLSWFFGHSGKGFIRKLRITLKFMASQTRQQTMSINIKPTISQSKDIKTMKYGQLMEYNMRNGFFQNHAENVGKRLVPDLF